MQIYESKQTLKPTVKSLVSEGEIAEFKDFESLSENKLTELFEEDQADGVKYLQKINRHQDFLRRQAEQKLLDSDASRELDIAALELQRVYDGAADKMEKVAPGIFDDSAVQEELVDFAETLGFHSDLFYLTNPETRIIPPGETEAVVLGDHAASVLGVLVNARTRMAEKSQADLSAEKSTLKAELEKSLRSTIEAEVLAKFKTQQQSRSDEYTSVDDIPTSRDDGFSGKVLTDAAYSKLSSADQERYLSGA